MMKCYLDSNLLIYFKNEKAEQHQSAKNIIKQLVAEDVRLVISPLVLDEFLHIILLIVRQKYAKEEQIYYVLQKHLDSILALPTLAVIGASLSIEDQRSIPKLMKKYRLRPRDAFHLSTMQQNNINKIATFDNDFNKAAEAGIVEVVN